MANVTQSGDPVATGPQVLKWALGLGGTWIILSFMVDLGWGELAAALAMVVAGGVVIDQGPDAIKNLGFLTS